LAENEKDNNKSAQYYFELANGYYNITFYGNSWMASSFNTRGLLPWGYTKEQNYDFYDCSRAEENYLKAAKKTANKEFAAQCYFMAAKCEQNKFYNNMPWLPYTYYMDTVDKEYLREKMKYKNYFSVLKEKYSQTDFYQEALKECNYFNYFVKNY
jgi:hypothetical protein